MAKVIAVMNMTLDGFCDHTAMIADDEMHQHYTDFLNKSGTLLYGRITYQLMENYWPSIAANPSGDKTEDDFAVAIENIYKVVFSHTLENVGWKNVRLAKMDLKEEVLALKQQADKDIVVGSPGLIAATLNLNLVDELQICVQPIIEGKGLQLFKAISERINLKLLRTKNFRSGSIVLCYEPTTK